VRGVNSGYGGKRVSRVPGPGEYKVADQTEVQRMSGGREIRKGEPKNRDSRAVASEQPRPLAVLGVRHFVEGLDCHTYQRVAAFRRAGRGFLKECTSTPGEERARYGSRYLLYYKV
jgi:hypothetical protein